MQDLINNLNEMFDGIQSELKGSINKLAPILKKLTPEQQAQLNEKMKNINFSGQMEKMAKANEDLQKVMKNV